LRTPSGQCAQATRRLPACSDLDKVSYSRRASRLTARRSRHAVQPSGHAQASQRTDPNRLLFLVDRSFYRPSCCAPAGDPLRRQRHRRPWQRSSAQPVLCVIHCPFASHLPHRRELTGAYRVSPSRSHVLSTTTAINRCRNRREIAGTAARSIGSLLVTDRLSADMHTSRKISPVLGTFGSGNQSSGKRAYQIQCREDRCCSLFSD
jgi:hypothetical protein